MFTMNTPGWIALSPEWPARRPGHDEEKTVQI
jgi:hypothetical protein